MIEIIFSIGAIFILGALVNELLYILRDLLPGNEDQSEA